MRKLKFLWAAHMVAIFLVVACAHPLSQQLKTGYDVTEAYVDRTERLFDAGAIGKVEAQERVAQAKRAKAGLDAARVSLAACIDEVCADARGKILAAQLLLNELESFLLEREVK